MLWLRASRQPRISGLRLGATSSGRRDAAGLKRQALKVVAELCAEVAALEGEFDCSLQHAEFVAGIEAFAFEGVAEDLLLFQESLDAVGELDFATGSGFGLLEQREDARSKHVAADDRLLR